MIVFNRGGLTEKVRLISQPRRRLQNQVFEPGSGILVANDSEIGITDHIEQEKSFDFLAGAVCLPFLGQMPASPESVGGIPAPDHRLFAIEKCQPYAVALQLLAAKLVGDGQQQS